MRCPPLAACVATALLSLAACEAGAGAGSSATDSSAGSQGETGESPNGEDAGEDTSTSGTSEGETSGEEAGMEETGMEETGTGETGGDDPDAPNLRPEDAPDWVVILVSGHCIPPSCAIPSINDDYMRTTGTGARFSDTLEAWGESVELWSYADELYNRDLATNELLPGEGNPTYYGFLQLHEDLQLVRDAWIADFDNPTKVLVVAHSHGVVWAHTALHVVNDLPVEVLIDLDGKSLAWEAEEVFLEFGDDWAAEIAAYSNQYQVSWPFDIGDAEGGWNIPGQGAMDIEDVIPDSVVHNLELQAIPGLVMPFPDSDDNRRLDGSRDGIITFVSEIEDHTEIDEPNSQGINWAIATFAQLVAG